MTSCPSLSPNVHSPFGALGPLFLFFSIVPRLLIWRPRPQLKRVYPSGPVHLFLQQSVHHPVPSGLHLRLEGFGSDKHTEMRLFGCAASHGLMVCVHAGVVVDLKRNGTKGCSDL